MKRFSMISLVSAAATLLAAPAQPAPPWKLNPHSDGSTLLSPAGQEVLGYLTTKPQDSTLSANSTCCFFPLLTPSGGSVVTLGPPDHKHHRGAFFAWYQMLGREKADFWGWGEYAPTVDRLIRNKTFTLTENSPEQATLRIANEWMVNAVPMVQEKLAAIVRILPEGRWLELTFDLTSTEEVVLPQAAFSGFCVKAKTGPDALITRPDGPVTLPSPHHLKPETDWPDAVWYDYSVGLETGKTAGISVFSHPANPPTKWHNIAGIGMINPCILAGGPVTLHPTKALTLRYALLIHDGAAPVDALNRLALRWHSLPE